MLQKKSNTIGAKLKVEPVRDFNIDLNIDRNFTRDHAETFKLDSVFGTNLMAFQHFTPFENGQYTISYVSLQTIFEKILTRYSNDSVITDPSYLNVLPIVME